MKIFTKNFHSIAILTPLIFTGCASLSKEECQQASWYAIGYNDGSHGYTAARYQKHQKACAKHHIKAEFKDYKIGHTKGLTEVYCKPHRAYQAGLNGETYHNVCPANMESQFLPAYHYGRNIYRLKAKYRYLNSEYNSLTIQISSIEQQISKLKQHLYTSKRTYLGLNDFIVRPDKSKIQTARTEKKQRRLLALHIHNELRLQQNILNQHLTTNSRPNYRNKQSLQHLIKLQIKRGKIHNQISWARMTKASQSHRRTLKTELIKIKRQIRNFYLQALTPLERKIIIKLAFHQGILTDQEQLLTIINKQRDLEKLQNLHFQQETVRLQLQKRLHKRKKANKNQRWQIRHQIRQLRQEKHNALDRIEEIKHLQNKVQYDIKQLKTDNPF